MTKKERVRRAIQHQQPDYVPSSLEGVEAAWEKLKKHFKTDTKEGVWNALDIDLRNMYMPPYRGPKLSVVVNSKGEQEYTGVFGERYVKKWNGMEYNNHTTFYPMAGIEDEDAFEKFTEWPNPDYFDYDEVKRFCDRNKDCGIRVGLPGPYQVFLQMYPPEDFYMLMVEEPELVKRMLNRFSEFYLELYERMLIAGDGAIDILRTCDDYGTQQSLLFSPSMWEEFFAENTKKLVNLAHKYGCYFMQHSCGAVRPIIPNLIQCGVDILDPIQKVVGMEVEALKNDFGDKLTFHGGIDTQRILPLGTPEEVRMETKNVIRVLNQNGGYILAPSQDFEGDVPLKNMLALYEARER